MTYGIRPEHLGVGAAGLAGDGGGGGADGIGDACGGARVRRGREMVAMFRDRVAFRPGDALVLAPDADKVHLFDERSGVRL